jgi:sugar lactone lactonase YvrE
VPIHFTCAKCAHAISLDDSGTTRTTTCPACGAAVAAPAADAWWASGPQPEQPPAQPNAPAGDWWTTAAPPAPTNVTPAPVPLTPLPQRPVTASRAPIALVAAGGAALLVVAAVVAVLALPPRKPAPSPVVLDDTDKPRTDKPAQTEQQPEQLVTNNPPVTQSGSQTEDSLPGRLTPRLWLNNEPRDNPPEQTKPRADEPKAKPDQPKVKDEPKPQRPKVVVKRRKDVDADERLKQLEKQLAKAPILTLDTSARRAESVQLIALGKKAHADDAAVSIMEKRHDLHGLPWLKGDACKISSTAADSLEEGSIALRNFMSGVARTSPRAFLAGGSTQRPDPKNLHEQLNKNGRDHNRWQKPEAIPALQQLLMAEDEAVREVLVDQLATIEGKKASVALAHRALFDLNPNVRERALNALADRPAAEYRDTLLAGFNYPWPVVAEHAAEAVIALKMKDAVAPLLAVLDMPDPQAPYKDSKRGMVVKELVRVNHLLNCVMCHAPSTAQTDKVRGRVPVTTQALPPAFSRQYYADTTGTFVRANVTYLRQDFSVPMKVEKPGLWPAMQRFDFMVRERPATLADSMAAKKVKSPTPHQQSVVFALRELTGEDPGPTVEDWKKHLVRKELKVQAVHVGLKNGQGIAQIDGALYVSDSGAILRKEGDAKPTTWLKDASGIEALAADGKGGLLAINGRTRAVAKVDLSLRELSALAVKKDARRFYHPRRMVADKNSGTYVSDDPDADLTNDRGAVYYLSQHGTVTKLSLGQLSRPRGVALSGDGKTLYVASAASADVMAYEVESAGSLGKGKRLAKVGTGAADLAVDSKGNVSVLDPAGQSVEVYSSAGAKLGTAKLPDTPVACVARETTLFVLTKKGIYSLDLSGAGLTPVSDKS